VDVISWSGRGPSVDSFELQSFKLKGRLYVLGLVDLICWSGKGPSVHSLVTTQERVSVFSAVWVGLSFW
jgi:hypothetical protein